MLKKAIRSKPLRAALTVVVGAVLLWQVATRTFVAYLAGVAPGPALSLRSDDAGALMNLAEKDIRQVLERVQEAGSPTSGGTPAQGRPIASGPATANKVAKKQISTADRIRTWARLARTAQGLTETGAKKTGAGTGTPKQVRLVNEQDRKRVEELARKALADDPLNAHAISMLGRLAILAGDTNGANVLMAKAANRSQREGVAIYWMMEQSHATGNFALALKYADVLLRTRTGLRFYVYSVIGKIAEDKAGNVELKKMLKTNPPWRSAFFAWIVKNITDARTPLDLLLALKDTPNPPTTSDLRPYLKFLINRKFYELAYYTWLQFLSDAELKSAGLLVNGGFEKTPSGLPFDWDIQVGAGVSVEIEFRPDTDGEKALFIEFTHGRVEFNTIRQMTLLGAGTYELTGNFKGQVTGRRGLLWRVVCAATPRQPLAQSNMALGTISKWRPFNVVFIVPKTDCRAQYVELKLDARSASERLVTGVIWYDDLVIKRVPGRPALRPTIPAQVP